jgi:CBS domain-containing protein
MTEHPSRWSIRGEAIDEPWRPYRERRAGMNSAGTVSGTATGTTAGEIMSPPLMTVEREAHLAAAAYLMHRDRSSALIVVSDDAAHRPLGVVTDSDIAQAVAAGQDLNEVRIKDLPPREPVVIPPQASVETAARTMLDAGVRQLPVVADDGVLGMVTISDACRALLTPAE